MSFPGKQIALVVAGEKLVQAFNNPDSGCETDDLPASTTAIAVAF